MDYYKLSRRKNRKTSKLDTIIKERNYPLPDLIKIDTQGSELDILNGSSEALKNIKYLIVELQHIQYNKNAKFFIKDTMRRHVV